MVSRRKFLMILLLGLVAVSELQGEVPEKLIPVQRIGWPEETRCLEMFSALVLGPDGLVYAGTCNNKKIGGRLVSFDPGSGKQQVLLDVHEITGEDGTQTYPQSKIHSQICFDSRGTCWFGTHSYEWNSLKQYQDSPEDYSGGYLISYNPKTKEARSHGILAPHESLMSMALAESVGKIYAVTHPTGRFLVYDLKTEKTTDTGIALGYPSRIVVALKDGRGITFTVNGDVVRYSPGSGTIEQLPVLVPTFDGETTRGHNSPFDLAVNADETAMYGIAYSSGILFEYRPDDGPHGSIRSLGVAFGDEVVPGYRPELSIAMAVGRDGRVYYAGYSHNAGKIGCYDPRTAKRSYLGRMDAGPGTRPLEAGAMISLPDGRLIVTTYDQTQTYYNLFHPEL
ncbi:MAG: hypothetical protein CMJ45_02980 [Planctomyces sp.]|nr:hypothetical protein [Planctomyces sp.]